jgi:hypothetical protein
MSPAVHQAWMSAMNVWQAADAENEASLSLDDGDDLISPSGAYRGEGGAHGATPSDADLERNCTPGKLKRYIALHLEKLIEHEAVRARLTEELTEAQAHALAFRSAFEAKESEVKDNVTLVTLLQDQVGASRPPQPSRFFKSCHRLWDPFFRL